MTTEEQKDQQLWELAQARAAFRKHIFTYALLNGFLVAIWLFTSGPRSHFWPIWSIMGWGIALAFQYNNAYNGNQETDVQREYNKLKNK